MATRILIAEDETIIRLDLRDLLVRAGFEVCAEARDGEEAVELARAAAPTWRSSTSRCRAWTGSRRLDGSSTSGRSRSSWSPRTAKTNWCRARWKPACSATSSPFRESDLLPAIATARARHEELQAARAEADSLAEALAARKAIERAKGLLMEREGLTEPEAFARLRKASQISGRPLKVVAEALIATLEP